jgi:enoyl-CoA hydratase
MLKGLTRQSVSTLCMTNQSNEVLVDLRDSVLWVTLNRPEVMNALSPTVLAAIDAAVLLAQLNQSVRCLVITGQGNAFCVGADLSTVPTGREGLSAFLRKAGETMMGVDRLSKPVIACVNGIALAGGLELALCADIVVAARSAEMGDGHIKYGLLPGAGGSARLTRAIGAGRARYLMYTGFRLGAERLESWGLVQHVVEDAALIDETAALARTIAGHSPLALGQLKRLVTQAGDLSLEASLALELAANEAHAGSADMKEGLAAFAEKRMPVFRGQ